MVYPGFFENSVTWWRPSWIKKMHKGGFWGLFGIRLGRCPCIIPEKISFLHFYPRFNPNALALECSVTIWLMNYFSSWPFMNNPSSWTRWQFLNKIINFWWKFLMKVSFVVQECSWTVHEHFDKRSWTFIVFFTNNHELFMNVHEE